MQRQILGYGCKKCGHVQYPYKTRCSKCHHVEWQGADIVFDTVPLPTSGTLLTFTELFALPADFEVVKLALGIVELDGGQRITGQIAIDAPRTGMRVKGKVDVVRTTDYEQHWGMVFEAE